MRLIRGVVVLLVSALGIGIFRGELERAGIWQRLAMPYRVARFYSQPADPTVLMPVTGVRHQAVPNTWHAPRSAGRKHEGQDIFARRGTPVIAAADGVVVRLGGGKFGGNAVFVAGRGARTYYYAHLDRYADIEVGQIVSRGDVVGYVGTSGNARKTPSHLHFGIYTVTGAINPLPLIVQIPPSEASD